MYYKEMMSAEHVNSLRSKFLKLSIDYSIVTAAKAIGISRPTLYRFIEGKRVYGWTIRKIMRWCERQDQCKR